MYKSFDERKKEIESYFEKEKQAELERLRHEHEKADAAAREENEALDRKFADEGNNLAVQYERNRRNFNVQAAARGLNTGTASQAELANNAMYLRQSGAHSARRTAAREKGIAALNELTASYEQKAGEASADIDRRRDQTIFSEREKHMQKMLSQASTLAKYGDFSLYAEIYGAEQAKNMERVWLSQNPNLAFSMGRLSLDEYRKITGRNPPGYGGGGGGGGGGRRRKKKDDKKDKHSGAVNYRYIDTRHPGNIPGRYIMDK